LDGWMGGVWFILYVAGKHVKNSGGYILGDYFGYFSNLQIIKFRFPLIYSHIISYTLGGY